MHTGNGLVALCSFRSNRGKRAEGHDNLIEMAGLSITRVQHTTPLIHTEIHTGQMGCTWLSHGGIRLVFACTMLTWSSMNNNGIFLVGARKLTPVIQTGHNQYCILIEYTYKPFNNKRH